MAIQYRKVVLFFPILEEGKSYHWPPISLLALSAVLKANNIEPVIIDERVEKDSEIKLVRELKDSLCLGITAFTGFSLHRALKAADICRKYYHGKPIIMGGPHATALPEQCKKSKFIDDIVIGYGEYEFLYKVQKIANNEDYQKPFDRSDINKQLMSDAMPLIPYELIDIHKYINPETEATIYLTSYGCPGKCTFCSTQTLRKWVQLSRIKVLSDLHNLFRIYPFKHIVFYDATFFVDMQRVKAIIDYIQKYQVDWEADARTIEAVKIDKDMLTYLENNRLKSITIGMETGSPKIINIMEKGRGHLERMFKIIYNFRNSPIKIASGIIFGLPGETIKDLRLTLKAIKELSLIKNNFKVSTTFFRPLPGTALFKVLEKDYKMKFPESLEQWAELGEKSHYNYNELMDIPWFSKNMETEYKKIYTDFWHENSCLFENGSI
jgi:anaerobic magnesium-protoporphyrin IX monomethyl ester cyclase